jgi:hypothetical protein
MPRKKSLYSVHPSIQMMVKWVAELKGKTGRTLPEWVAFIKKEGPPTEVERRDWLKKVHGLGTNSAWWIAERASGKGGEEDTPEGYLKVAPKYVEEMFAGKAGLRPVYDNLLAMCLDLAPDVKACPCQTIVPIYRTHVIAEIKPATKTRIDFGYALGDLGDLGELKATGRLIDTGGFAKKNRITHRIPIASVDEIDKEVRDWLKRAYDRDE